MISTFLLFSSRAEIRPVNPSPGIPRTLGRGVERVVTVGTVGQLGKVREGSGDIGKAKDRGKDRSEGFSTGEGSKTKS